jgi:Holliday junction resolvase
MLDVNSPKGQESLEHELRAVELWQHHYSEFTYVHTPKSGSALVDAVIVDNDTNVVAVVEQKSRNMSLDQLQKWDMEWLVTYAKIEAGRTTAHALGVPFVGFLYLIPDDLLITKQLANNKGEWTCSFRKDFTETQETINGGKIVRENAYIDLTEAKHIRQN